MAQKQRGWHVVGGVLQHPDGYAVSSLSAAGSVLEWIYRFRNRSMSSAARLLGISQPAVSQSIAGLEGELRLKLFARNQQTGVLQPTVEASRLHATVCDMLDSWSEFRQSM